MAQEQPKYDTQIDEFVEQANREAQNLAARTHNMLLDIGGLKWPKLFISEDLQTAAYFGQLISWNKRFARVVINRVVESEAPQSRSLEITDYLCNRAGGLLMQRTFVPQKSDAEVLADRAAVEAITSSGIDEFGVIIPGTLWHSDYDSGPILAYSDYELAIYSGNDYEESLARRKSVTAMRDPILHAELQASIGVALSFSEREIVHVMERHVDTK